MPSSPSKLLPQVSLINKNSVNGILHQYFTCFLDYWGKNTTKFTKPSQEPGLNFLPFLIREKGKISIISWLRAMIWVLSGKELGEALGHASSTLIVWGMGAWGAWGGGCRSTGLLLPSLSMIHVNFSWKKIHKHWDVIWHLTIMYLGEVLSPEWQNDACYAPFVVSVTILSHA